MIFHDISVRKRLTLALVTEFVKIKINSLWTVHAISITKGLRTKPHVVHVARASDDLIRADYATRRFPRSGAIAV